MFDSVSLIPLLVDDLSTGINDEKVTQRWSLLYRGNIFYRENEYCRLLCFSLLLFIQELLVNAMLFSHLIDSHKQAFPSSSDSSSGCSLRRRKDVLSS